MKFSVLLPTRNRLDLLAFAIESVRRQDYFDWEVIVSDNDSGEDICGYVHNLRDRRIKCYRTESFIPVTENWTRALDRSDGDYIIMLGDDDSLMPGYFSRLKYLIDEFGQPDFVYTSAYLYAYPGVLPGSPDGFLRSYDRCPIFRGSREPFWLDPTESARLVKMSLQFKIRFDYNMQFSLVSRRLIQSLATKGPFYQSPYPDYYASNVMMLKARRILVVPENLVVIGISPKSFGYYYFNDSEFEGTAFLKNIADPDIAARLSRIFLPGTDMNTSWLLSMETMVRNFGDEQRWIKVNYSRYRFLQIVATHVMALLGKPGAVVRLARLRSLLSFGEWLRYGVPLLMLLILALPLPRGACVLIARILSRFSGSHPRNEYPTVSGNFKNIQAVFDFFSSPRKSVL